MNICLVSREYPPETGWGGMGTGIYNLAHRISEFGHIVHVISKAVGEECSYKDRNVIVHRVKMSEYKPRNLWRLEKYFPIDLLLYSRRVAKKIAEIHAFNKLDIVEFPEWGLEGAWFLFKKRSFPVVLKFHGPAFIIQKFNNVKITLRHRFICFIERIMSARMDGIIALSLKLAEEVAENYRINIKKIKVLYNCIDDDLFYPKQHDCKERIVLFVGRLEYRKGVHILASCIPSVINKFPNVKFVFIGKDTIIDGKLMSDLIKERSGFAKNLFFLGFLERTALIEHYQKSCVCVFPSLNEPLGNVCLEAMACGKPVVVNNNLGMSELVRNNKNGFLVEPGNIDMLSKAIINILSDTKLEDDMGKYSQMIIKEEFTKKPALDTIGYYKEIIHKFLICG